MENVKTNCLDFKLIDPIAAGEDWAEDWAKDVSNPPHVVEIYVDGVEIVEIFKKIEDPYCKAEGHPEMAGSYGHVSAKDLYNELKEATVKDSYTYELGVYPLCCRDCAMEGCWSVTFHVREDENYVWWYNFKHEHRRRWEYNLEFKFLKSDYAIAINKLSLWNA